MPTEIPAPHTPPQCCLTQLILCLIPLHVVQVGRESVIKNQEKPQSRVIITIIISVEMKVLLNFKCHKSQSVQLVCVFSCVSVVRALR